MKKTQKLTFAAIMAALACAMLLAGYFPYLTYAIPAVSGLFVMVVFLEAGAAYAVGAYISSAVISFLLAEKEVAVLYILIFGYYPVLKAYIEKLNKPVFRWALKLAVFNAAAVCAYYITSFILGITYDDFGMFGKYGALIFLAICNGVFVLYDIAVSRMAAFYFARLHGKIKRVFK